MHELAIAESIVHIAGDHARGQRVTAVYVRVGHLRQVVPDALAFAFALVSEGTPVADARLELEEVPIVVACRACGGAEHGLDGFPLACPVCGGFDVTVVSGEELQVDSLELEHELTRSG
jgi:hydrogenase nickel incorporation protein HypA/HybF